MTSRPAPGVLLAAAFLAAAFLATAACGTSTAPAAAPASAPAPMAGTDMSGTDMSGTDMSGTGMSGMDMSGMHMDESALWAVQTGPLGVIVTDGAGRMLYRSDADSASPPAARCAGRCAGTWVPMRLQDGQLPDLEGVDAAQVGSVPRADGAPQVTLAGWPLYRHHGEPAGLATTGANGRGGWFVVTPSGGRAAT